MKSPLVCPVDVGYGYVKTLGFAPFSSVLVKTSSEAFFKNQDFIEGENPFLISFDGEVFALGETAMNTSRNPKTIMEGNKRWAAQEYKALMLGGIVRQLPKGNINVDIILVTGLPYLQSQNAEEVEGIKKEFTQSFKVNILEDRKVVTKTFKVVQTLVMSQPRGAYYGLLALTQKRIKNELALIADLGFKSLDYLVTQNGQETQESNGEDAIAGMERVYTSLIRELRTKGLPAVKPHELDCWLFEGKLDDYAQIIDDHLNKAAETIIGDIKEKLGAFWEKLSMVGAIYFVGGSAKRLQPYLEKNLNMRNVYFVDASQQLIVEGYGAYGRAVSRKTYGGVYSE